MKWKYEEEKKETEKERVKKKKNENEYKEKQVRQVTPGEKWREVKTDRDRIKERKRRITLIQINK